MGAVDSRMAQDRASLGNRLSSDEEADPPEECLEKLRSLKLSIPLLKTSAERISKEQGMARQATQPPGTDVGSLVLDPASTLALFQLYDTWQQAEAAQMSERQSGIHSSVESAEALAIKVRQRLLYSSSALKTQGAHLEEVRAVQKEVESMKRELSNVAKSFQVLCDRLTESGVLKERGARGGSPS